MEFDCGSNHQHLRILTCNNCANNITARIHFQQPLEKPKVYSPFKIDKIIELIHEMQNALNLRKCGNYKIMLSALQFDVLNW